MEDEKLDIEPRGDKYVLIRTSETGEITEVILSADSILKLAQNAQRLKGRVLQSLSRPGVDAEIVTTVSRISLNSNLQYSALLLGLFDQNDAETLYRLPLEVVKGLPERIQHWIVKIEAAISTQTKQ